MTYVESENYKLYLSDIYQIIKSISTSSMDLKLTDPLYNVAKYSTTKMTSNLKSFIYSSNLVLILLTTAMTFFNPFARF